MDDFEIFHNAPENATPEELAAYLDEACGDDAELRARVEELCVMQSRTDDFLEDAPLDLDAATIAPGGQSSGKAAPTPTPSASGTAAASLTEKSGDVIGPFTLIEKLGEGGFGTVWKAQQSVPFVRTVALKIIKLGMDTREVLNRFEAERQALAMMDHHHIAKVLDAGATENGRPYFVMELVDGVPITKYCDERGLGTRERLGLFRDVCAAVNHAHQKGMIHRDIKPSNVMVTTQDGKPVVKVIDFGIAKATEGKLTEETLVTLQEQVIGTPAYMSPEQAGMDGLDIDTRSDIYSLGVLLYELLSGKPPFDPKTLMAAGFDEMRRIVREEEPPRPSNRVSTISGAEETVNTTTTHGTEPRKLSRILRGDLDWIVMKALEKDRGRRYETANAFAADIAAFMTDQAVSATPPSASYRFRKFARRNKVVIGVQAAVITILFLSGYYSYTKQRNEVFHHLQSMVFSIAATAAVQVDGDLHEKVKNSGDESTEAYQTIEAQLRKIRDANNRNDVQVRYIRTMRRISNDRRKWIYVIDAEESGIEKASIGEYTDAEEPIRLGEAYVDNLFVADRYGTWLSAYAPVRTSDGTIVAMLGVKLSAIQVIAETRQVFWINLFTFLITLALLTGTIAVILSQ